MQQALRNLAFAQNPESGKPADLGESARFSEPRPVPRGGAAGAGNFRKSAFARNYIIPPMPPIDGSPMGAAGFSSGLSAIMHSVVSSKLATLAAF